LAGRASAAKGKFAMDDNRDEPALPNRNGLLSACRKDLEAREEGYLAELRSLDEAAAGETKSSAGDKYETGREMIAQSRNLIQRNLAEMASRLEALARMLSTPPQDVEDSVGFGSLVETDSGWCLVGISLGEVDFQGQSIRTASLASPLGSALKGGRAGDRIPWRGGRLEILRMIR
jgi:transcription elongation GreA/GreB family factor